MSDKLVKATYNSPKRCQGIDRATDDQCEYIVALNQIYCVKHLTSVAFREKRKSFNQYKLAIYTRDYDEQLRRSDIKHLGEELMLTRECTQRILNLCKLEMDLLQYSPNLQMLIRMTQEIAQTLHSINVTMETLLDKGILMDLLEEALESIVPLLPDQSKALDLADTLTAIVADEMGAGMKVTPPRENGQTHRITKTADGTVVLVPNTPAALTNGTDTDTLTIPTQAESNITLKQRISYRLKHWDFHLKGYYANPRLTDLRSELALSRILLQATLNMCPTPATLIHNMAKIVGNLNLIRGLTVTIQKIDYETGYLLDRTNVSKIADQIAKTVVEYLNEDEELLASASRTLTNVFAELFPGETNKQLDQEFGQDMLEMGGNLPDYSGSGEGTSEAVELQTFPVAG